jgi:hypothetical protein
LYVVILSEAQSAESKDPDDFHAAATARGFLPMNRYCTINRYPEHLR